MEKFWDALRGYAELKVTGAEPAAFLNVCLERGLEFWNVQPLDEFSIRLTMTQRDAEMAGPAAEKCLCELETLRRGGGPRAAARLKRRKVLWVLPLAFLLLLTLSSFFVWRIEVQGNETVSETEILNALEDSGVAIGGYWPSFNSELIRSRVLAEIPELKWLSVSTFGSRTYVEVREKTEAPDIFDESERAKIVALRGGLIQEISVLRGAGAVEKGDIASAGETLIEGVVISPYAGPRFVHAAGSVQARTWYELTAVLPMEYREKVYTGKSNKKYALILGGRRINFYGNSGIWDASCDNIITEHRAEVEGVFSLPLSVVVMTMEEYELRTALLGEDQARERLEATLASELEKRLEDRGAVVSAEFTFTVTDGVAVGTLRAECLEDIAKEKPLSPEEISEAKAESEDNTAQ